MKRRSSSIYPHVVLFTDVQHHRILIPINVQTIIHYPSVLPALAAYRASRPRTQRISGGKLLAKRNSTVARYTGTGQRQIHYECDCLKEIYGLSH